MHPGAPRRPAATPALRIGGMLGAGTARPAGRQVTHPVAAGVTITAESPTGADCQENRLKRSILTPPWRER